MKKTISENDFIREFNESERNENFSQQGLSILFDYFEEIEGNNEYEIELDVISVCCDYTEYESFEDIKEEYDFIEYLADLYDNTLVLEIPGTKRIIIRNF